MTNIFNAYFESAQMSLAAYALSLKPTMSRDEYIGALVVAGISTPQATNFADTYSILSQSPVDPDGFSATLFADRLDPARKILAIRGVDNAFDFLRHVVDIGLLGTSDLVLQYRTLNNYYQQLITQGLLGEEETFTVAGHSLGGFLAQLFTLDHANVVSHADTYNAPGIGGVVAEVLSAFDITQTSIPGSLITNVFAQTGPEFVAGAGTLLGSTQPVFIENQGLLAIPGNHGIVPLTDSLAVYSLFARLAPTVPADTITNILKAVSYTKNAADTTDETLESALDALRVFIADYQQGTSTATVTPTIQGNRDSFYTNLLNLQAEIRDLSLYNETSKSLGLSVASLVGADTGTLFKNAKQYDSVRYALAKLNPFTITGNPALYDQINFDGSLDLYSSETGTGALTDQYLRDRSAFLYNKILSGNADTSTRSGDAFVAYAGAPQIFEDKTSDPSYKLYLGKDKTVSDIPADEMTRTRFGAVAADQLYGSTEWDHLYGMAGDDTLQGGKGNDYLEGGEGTDTYAYSSGDGLDTILDIDGLGKITFDGVDLNGGEKLFGDTYRSADGKYLYTLLHNTGSPDSLLISAMGGQIVVKDFQDENMTREAA